MRTLITLYSQLEAELLTQRLVADNIQAVVNGGREYASIVTGRDDGRFRIEVSEEDFDAALNHLEEIQKAQPEHLDLADFAVPTASQQLRKAIFFACAGGVVLPLVFNLLSLRIFMGYWNNKESEGSRYSGLAAFVAAQFVGLIGVWMLYRGLL